MSRISYFGNSRGHEIYCVSVREVRTLVDLRTLMTHPEDDSSGVTYFYCVDVRGKVWVLVDLWTLCDSSGG